MSLKITSEIDLLRSAVQELRTKKKEIGFVPTMGFLHDGHLSLVRKAKKDGWSVVVSIFVNPTQFAPNEDFARYPRNIERDTALLTEAGCDILFIPSVDEIYPNGYSSYIEVEGVSAVLEGKFRPVHFKGVTTAVAKLFNIVGPDVAYFGQKDAQQCAIIKKMVHDLNIPVRIEIVPTVREADGLAMSSRNVYLSREERKNATVLYESLLHAEKKIRNGERASQKIITEMKELINAKDPTQIDYVEIVDRTDLHPKSTMLSGESVLIVLAVKFGSTRLIDNMIVTV